MNCIDCRKETRDHYRIDDGAVRELWARATERGIAGLCRECADRLADPPAERATASAAPGDCADCGKLYIWCECVNPGGNGG